MRTHIDKRKKKTVGKGARKKKEGDYGHMASAAVVAPGTRPIKSPGKCARAKACSSHQKKTETLHNLPSAKPTPDDHKASFPRVLQAPPAAEPFAL
ncbi:hypothetical protein psal_cds_415 [Pandoravirus salinus]|uniref:Uncharacterized protein n=1 Tax=Pandoravirus salinus TaxID=1349410 RepID=S4VUC5_9VIRU|nr:hypothetical protein psal_cds_415 [Pandoravirus salinus]AGO84134.1 hypothetical protein psal_cds_415 [Pandoravirus salinus]